jgi:hypothetical protein
MTKVKQIAILLIISLFPLATLSSISLQKTQLPNPFPSEENLQNFEKTTNLDQFDKEALDNIEISLITIAPADPIYSWFGHSAILVQQDENTSIIYDYGIFSFNSENFYKNFLQGKMYYLLLPSYAENRMEIPIEENRTVTKVKLNIADEKKVDIINFLNYNARSENNTYLYDFYVDNCATRIRDIVNWITDGDFEDWAKEQYTPYTYRILSTEELDRSLFVNWVLNSFLGKNCDINITTWEAMFAPQYLEQAFLDYEKLNPEASVVYQTDDSTTFDKVSSKSLHLLFYTLISVFLSIIALVLKKLKQDKKWRLYGIYNSIIIFFLLIVSLGITYLTLFSHIQPAWYNENIFFLNPVIVLILFYYSLNTLHKKKKSTRRLMKFEKVSFIYSIYLLIFIIAKNIFSNVLFQQNYIILVPLFIFFFIQSFILNTKR